MKPDNSERNARIIELRKAGKLPREIAKALGVTHNVVIGVCNRAGLCRWGAQHAALPRGEDHPLSVLTEAAVRDIRDLYRRGIRGRGYASLGHIYGVSPYAIRHAVIGKSWAHVQ